MTPALSSFLEKLQNELYKSLQYIDQNSQEYYNRILDEIKFIKLCKVVERFYSELNDHTNISR
jgi:chemotaxis regulatin CheY-phosphate phosphatase CheZ